MKEYKSRHRYRFTFSKKGAVCFVSHLDLLRVFQGALRRSGLPVSYSQGFNPHQKMSFAFPLTTGFEGENELVELEFDVPVDMKDVMNKLNDSTPDGLTVFAASEMTETEQTAASRVMCADYRVTFPGIAPDKLAEISAGMLSAAPGSLIIAKENKKGKKEEDIRSDIFGLSVSADSPTVDMSLAAGSHRNLKPEHVSSYICAAAGVTYEPRRIITVRKGLLLG